MNQIIILTISMDVLLFGSAESGVFVPPANNTVAHLRTQLEDTQMKISFLAQTLEYKSNESEQMIATLENNIETLRRELDDESQRSAQSLAIWQERVENLTAQLNDFSERILPYDCIREIEAGRFESAEKKLEILRQNETLVADIINKVYGGRMRNIRLLNNFGKSLTRVSVTLMVYKSLANDLEETSDDPVYEIREIIDLLKSVESQIIYQPYGANDVRNVGYAVTTNKLRDVLKKMSANVLGEAMQDDTFPSNPNVSTITSELYTVDINLFFDAISDVCNREYGKLDANRILRYVSSYSLMAPRIDALTALFYAIRNTGDSNSSAMYTLTSHIKEMTHHPLIGHIQREVRARLQKLESELPTSLSDKAFANANTDLWD